MGPADFIAIGVIALVVGAAAFYIIKAKRSGKRCIGCPDSATCGKAKESGCSGSCHSCTCGCSADNKEKEE